ncbi:MAG: immunity 49 family protein [Myxococcota bacterium]|nr:immunity 49 family protein [Myxococcota bacterium]
MTNIPSHKFKGSYTAEEVDEDLAFLRNELGRKLANSPSAMGGKQVAAQFTRGCGAYSVGRPKDALEAFHASVECSGAQFSAVSAEPNTTIAFVFRGNTLTGPAGAPQFGALPPYWIQAVFLSAALQRSEILETLLAVPLTVFDKAPGEVDACYIHLVHALKAFFAHRDFAGNLEEFDRLSRPESLKIATPPILERYRAIGPVLAAFEKGDALAFNQALIRELEAHKKTFGKGKDANTPNGLIDVHAAGLMRLALNRGLKLDVESDYVPKWLIGLEQS